MLSTDYDFMFKLVVIGDPWVGKTSLIRRFADDVFSENYFTTIGVDFKFRKIERGENVVKVQVWDTGGYDRFGDIVRSYYRGGHGFLVSYDITEQQSFQNIPNYLEKIKEFSEPSAVVSLVGTKSDLVAQRKVSEEEGQELAKRYNIQFFETSSKNANNIDDVIEYLVDEIQPRALNGEFSCYGHNGKLIKRDEKPPPQPAPLPKTRHPSCILS